MRKKVLLFICQPFVLIGALEFSSLHLLFGLAIFLGIWMLLWLFWFVFTHVLWSITKRDSVHILFTVTYDVIVLIAGLAFQMYAGAYC